MGKNNQGCFFLILSEGSWNKSSDRDATLHLLPRSVIYLKNFLSSGGYINPTHVLDPTHRMDSIVDNIRARGDLLVLKRDTLIYVQEDRSTEILRRSLSQCIQAAQTKQNG